MERYHIFKLGLAILFYAAYCIRPMLVDGLRTKKTDLRPEDYLVFYQVKDGIPGTDFPILSNIPKTSFSCQNFETGYYADLDTDCQAFHICDEGRKISFLCPNGTIFDQSELICEWWFKVDCTNAPNLYHESAERLREDLARRRALKKVHLDGRERQHGAVMRIEEPLSVGTKKNGNIYEFSPRASNIVASNGNNRINVHPSERKGIERNKLTYRNRGGSIPSQRTIEETEVDEQKPRRFNDDQTGNYINNVQLSGTSPGLDTASSEKHVQTRSTTPSSLNRVSSSDIGKNLFKSQLNGRRGSVKYKTSFEDQPLPSSAVKPSGKYDLAFPKHRSQVSSEGGPESRTISGDSTIKIDSSKIDLSLPGETKGKGVAGVSETDILKQRIGTTDSSEVQIPQETAAFAKSSYNTIQPSIRKFSTANPYPNHRTTYSDLKKPSYPTTNVLGSIKSVTPQYITTQSINNGKPFIGSTVGASIYGNKFGGSTLTPEVHTVTSEFSSTGEYSFTSSFQPVSSTGLPSIDEITNEAGETVASTFRPPPSDVALTASIPSFKDSSSTTGRIEASTFQPAVSTAFTTSSLEDTTRIVNQRGEFSVRPVASATASATYIPPVEGGTGITQPEAPTLQPSSLTTVLPSLEHSTETDTSTFRPGAAAATTYASPLEGIAGTTSQPETPIIQQSSVTTVLPLKLSTKKTLDHATVYGLFPKSSVTTPVPRSGIQVKFGDNVDKVSVQLTKSFGGESPKYSSAVTPPLKSGTIVHISDLQDTIQSSTVGISPESDHVTPGGTETRSSAEEILSGPSDKQSTVAPPVATDAFGHITGFQTGTVASSIETSIKSGRPVTISGDKYIGKTAKPSIDLNYPRGTSAESIQDATESVYGLAETQTGTDTSVNTASTLGGGKHLSITIKTPVEVIHYPSTISSDGLPDTVERTTSEPTRDNLKYGSSVVPPLLRSQSFVHVSDLHSSVEPTRDLLETSTGASVERGQSTPASFGSRTESFARATVPSVDIFLNSVGSTFPPESGPIAKEAISTSKPPEGFLKYEGTSPSPFSIRGTFRPTDLKGGTETSGDLLVTGAPSIKATISGGLAESTATPSISLFGEELSGTGTSVPASDLRSTIGPSASLLDFDIGKTESSVKATISKGSIRSTVRPSISLLDEETTPASKLSEIVSPLSFSVTPVPATDLQGITGTRAGLLATGYDKAVESATLSESPVGSTVLPSISLLAEATDKTALPAITSESPVRGTVVPSTGLLGEGATSTPEISEITSKYSTTKSVDSTFVSSFGADTVTQTTLSGDSTGFGTGIKPSQDSADISSLPNLKSFIQGANKLKPSEEQLKYGSSVIPPLLTPNAFVHVGDFQKISKPAGGTAVDTGKGETRPGDVGVLQNIIGTTVTPDVHSFAEESSLKPKPVDNIRYDSESLIPDSQSTKSPIIKPFGIKTDVAGGTGFYVTKNSVYEPTSPSPFGLSSTANYEQSTPLVSVNLISGGGEIQPLQSSSPKFEFPISKDSFLGKPEAQQPKPFQKPQNIDDSGETSTKTVSVTPAYLNYKISSARPFKLPDTAPVPTLPTPFTAASPKSPSAYENVDNMINILKEIVNITEQDFSSETPRPGLIVPPSVGPQTLHTLAVYFANALDGIAAEREKLTGEELDPESKEKLTSLLTQMTMYRYKELFKGREPEKEGEVPTTVATEEILRGDDSENLIQTPALRDLAKNFSVALSSYLNDPEAFRKDLESLRPTEPPAVGGDITETGVGEEELLNFSDADSKSSIPPVFPTLPSATPTWSYIIAPKSSGDSLDVKNSLNPDLHTADTQSFVPGFNNLAIGGKGFNKADFGDKKELPEGHWTASPGATKLWQSTFSVNPAIVNEHFVATEPPLQESTGYHISAPSTLSSAERLQTEIQYDLRSLPKISVNMTQVHGILIDFVNATKADESNRLQRLLKKLNTTEDEFLNRMKEIESNPLTRRLILLLISECGANATKDFDEQEEAIDLSKEKLDSSNSNSAVASFSQSRHLANSDIPALVNPSLREDDQDTRALQLLNTLYTIAAKFGK